MTDAKTRRTFPYRSILSALMGVVLLYLAATFVMRAGVSLELREKLRDIEQRIVAAEQTNTQLDARLEYSSSDEAAEQWARENGWAMQNEVLVVVLAPEAGSAPRDGLRQEATPASNRDSWWDLFFGER
jgi:cell division protein FtsL